MASLIIKPLYLRKIDIGTEERIQKHLHIYGNMEKDRNDIADQQIKNGVFN